LAGYASIWEIKINGVPASAVTPVFTSPLSSSGNSGVAFNYQLTAAEGTSTYGATGLPTGLSIDPNTGIISGTSALSGIYPVTVTATNAAGTTTATFNLTLSPPTNSAPSTDTPTMSQWALLIMAALLIGLAYPSLAATPIGPWREPEKPE
jgi:hypothetical protein